MTERTNQKYQYERGIVSILIVLFSAIFMTIITVSFLSVMTHDQKQATQNDLSQNAYDSAMSGVEDAKRAIVKCQQNPGGSGCSDLTSDTVKCNTLTDILGIPLQPSDNQANQEYPLQQSESNNTLNQAYTCVTINSEPGNYKANLTLDTPLIIPLSANNNVNQVQFSWHPQDAVAGAPSLPQPNSGLLSYSEWRSVKKYPAVMRLQLIRLSSPMNFSDLDGAATETVFLYPTQNLVGGSTTNVDFSVDKRRDTPNVPIVVGCDTTTSVCQTTLSDGSNTMTDTSGQSLYLAMTPLYDNASITLSLAGGSDYFKGLQAVVDSTGRANDLFRRVQARVDLIPHPTYPNSALSLQGSLCKDFVVTPNPSGYVNSSTCP